MIKKNKKNNILFILIIHLELTGIYELKFSDCLAVKQCYGQFLSNSQKTDNLLFNMA